MSIGGELFMKKCKDCMSEIDDKAKKCPKCGSDQRGWFRRHPILTGILVLFLIGLVASVGDDSSSCSSSSEVTNNSDTVTTTEPTSIQEEHPDSPDVMPTSSETVSQKNAVKKAKSYLEYTAFSHDGLVTQLEFEKFSHEDAVYGADNSGADWNEQAAKKAKSYMDYSAFSRGSLIQQLEFDKFTPEQAEFGADAVGL